jgi:hypothetical protein
MHILSTYCREEPSPFLLSYNKGVNLSNYNYIGFQRILEMQAKMTSVICFILNPVTLPICIKGHCIDIL